MPSRATTLNIQVLVHPTATDFLDATEHILEKHDLTSNILLPFAIKARKAEALPVSRARGPAYWSAPRLAPTKAPQQFWLTQWTSRSAASVPSLDLVVAVTEGLIDAYPVFFWSPHPSNEMSPYFLVPRVQAIVAHLLWAVVPERVFSVFGKSHL